MAAAWSSLGLIAVASGKNVSIIDPTVPFSDALYCRKVAEKEVSLMFWNSLGTLLALSDSEGNVSIYKFEFPGRLDSLNLIYTEPNNNPSSPPVAMTWCENRRVFSWNSAGLSNGNPTASSSPTNNTSSSSASCLISRNYQVDFLPEGYLGMVILYRDGRVKVLRQSLRPTSTGSSSPVFECVDLVLPDCPLSESVLLSSAVIQRSNGNVLILLRQAGGLSIYRLFNVEGQETQIVINFNARIAINPIDPVHEKFVWFDSREQIAHLALEPTKNSETLNFILQHYTIDLQTVPGMTKTTQVPSSFKCIVHSQRAAGYFLTTLERASEVMMLNLSGNIGRNLKLDQAPATINSPPFSAFSPLLISPNGLCICQLATVGNVPLCFYTTVGELNHKNLPVVREFSGKMISSSVNGIDNWDIIQPLRKTILGLTNGDKEKGGSEAAMAFLSAFLSEWLSLLSAAGILPSEFYGKLLDFFRILSINDVFDAAYHATDLFVSLRTADKIIKSNSSNSEVDFASLVSLVPAVVSGLEKVRILVVDELLSSSSAPHGLSLLLLDDEFVALVTGLLAAAEQIISQLQMLLNTPNQRPQSLIILYAENMLRLESSLMALAPWSAGNDGKSSPSAFVALLQALRSDPQLLSKRTSGLFTFLTDVLLDTVNQDRIWTHMQRIWSRFGGHRGNQRLRPEDLQCVPLETAYHVFDAVRGIEVPVQKLKSSVLACRRCCRVQIQARAGVRPSVAENIYAADWSSTLFATRCPCGSVRCLIN